MARWKQGQKVTKSDWEWQKLYNNYTHHYNRLNRSEEGFHLLSEYYSPEEFKKVYESAKWKHDHQDPSIRVNALEIARSQRRSNYLQKIKIGDKEEVRGQVRMVAKLNRLKKGLKNNDPEAIAEYEFIKKHPALQDAFETYTGTTLFDEDWVHYFDPDERYVNNVERLKNNSAFKAKININQASFADNLDDYLDSLGLEHTKENYTMARDLFESALY